MAACKEQKAIVTMAACKEQKASDHGCMQRAKGYIVTMAACTEQKASDHGCMQRAFKTPAACKPFLIGSNWPSSIYHETGPLCKKNAPPGRNKGTTTQVASLLHTGTARPPSVA